MLLSVLYLASTMLLTLYLTGVIASLLAMVFTGLTPKRWGGLQRPWTAEEYLTEPLAWPIVLLWAWVATRRDR